MFVIQCQFFALSSWGLMLFPSITHCTGSISSCHLDHNESHQSTLQFLGFKTLQDIITYRNTEKPTTGLMGRDST